MGNFQLNRKKLTRFQHTKKEMNKTWKTAIQYLSFLLLEKYLKEYYILTCMKSLQKVIWYLLTNQILNQVIHVLTNVYPSLMKFTNLLTFEVYFRDFKSMVFQENCLISSPILMDNILHGMLKYEVWSMEFWSRGTMVQYLDHCCFRFILLISLMI